MKIDQRILDLCKTVTAKRPKTVIDYIIKHGFVTTEDLQNLGYDHPPRAARDVRENGIPLETFKVKSERTGRVIGAYRFADPEQIKHGRIGGRRAFSKAFKENLISRYGARDNITSEKLDPRYLQIDHRIPYEVAGDVVDDNNIEDFMLLDASSQRAKSWSCEQCKNWQELLDKEICRTCLWAFPENYTHVAMEQSRRAEVVWRGEEVEAHAKIMALAEKEGLSIPELIKRIVAAHLQ